MVVPVVVEKLFGVMAILTRVALLIFSVAAGLLTIPANTAVIEVCPAETPVARPC